MKYARLTTGLVASIVIGVLAFHVILKGLLSTKEAATILLGIGPLFALAIWLQGQTISSLDKLNNLKGINSLPLRDLLLDIQSRKNILRWRQFWMYTFAVGVAVCSTVGQLLLPNWLNYIVALGFAFLFLQIILAGLIIVEGIMIGKLSDEYLSEGDKNARRIEELRRFKSGKTKDEKHIKQRSPKACC